MKTSIRLIYADAVLLAVFLAGALFFRHVPGTGEFYSRHLYPAISAVLSAIASVFPFSLDEWTVVLAAVCLVAWPVAGRRKGKSWKRVLFREAELLVLVYVWFYWGWGMNYYRDSFYERAGVHPAAYDSTEFRNFLYSYSGRLDAGFREAMQDDSVLLMERVSRPGREYAGTRGEIKEIFGKVPEKYGLVRPYSFQKPKYTCFNFLYSGVGVLGYMGPFFAESHLNRDLLRLQYPFTYAHELSHLLGISSEAEANFWAYQVCVHSSSAVVRYSGYFGILPYVISNARALLGRDDYEAWLSTVDPSVIAQLQAEQSYWRSLYSPAIGRMQDTVYSMYLKGNRIPSAQRNYAEVVSLLLSSGEIW